MSKTFIQLFVHMVFSTKHREPLIRKADLPLLHEYIAGILNNIHCQPVKIGGTENHVHVLFGLDKTLSISEVARLVKANSSKWIKEQNVCYESFAWQDGYGAFTVSKSIVDKVRNYIANQEQHHRKSTYENEILDFLKQQDLEVDDKYLFD